MRQLRRLPGVFALTTVLFWSALATTIAQQSSPAASPPAAQEGMREAISRQYGADPSGPNGGSATNQAGAPFVVTARIVAYDTEEHASAGYAEAIAGAMDQVGSMGVNMETQVEDEEINALGDDAHGLTVHSTQDSVSGYIRFLFVRDGASVHILSAIAGSEEGAHIADRIAEAMLAREPGEGDAEFRADGTSTGGLWDIFLPTDDPALEGLVIIQDQHLLAPATPAAG